MKTTVSQAIDLTLSGIKCAFRTRQRMETPVIYFYSDTERAVDVTVKFPQGLVTEWFPQVREIGPSWVQPRPALAKMDQLAAQAGLHPNFSSLDTGKGISESVIRWTDVKILPAKQQAQLKTALAVDPSGSHYYAARETDADFLRVEGNVKGTHTLEHEKFLFYRGIGNFQTPLQVTMSSGEDCIQLRNPGGDELTHLFVLQVHGGKGRFVVVTRVAAGAETTVQLDPKSNQVPLREMTAQLRSRLQEALAKEGLYEREATAMVQTWHDSWLEEEGTRVLYILP